MKKILFLLFAACSGIATYAQDEAPLVQFGNFEGYGVRDVTIDKLLEHPYIKCLEKKCKVTSFDIYGITPGKEYIGPYTSEGDTLSEPQQRYIRSLVRNGNLWINNIHLKYTNGKEKIIGRKETEYSIYFFNIR